jgi:hypothetical protein
MASRTVRRGAAWLLLVAATSMPVRAQTSASDSATQLYRDATAAFSRGDANRASRLFTALRQQFPSSLYTGDSYIWQATALAQQRAIKERAEARRLLTEYALRFPAEAGREDVVALEQQLDDALRPGSAAAAADTTSCVSEMDEASLMQAMALVATSPAESEQALAALLSRRTPCTAAVRRAAVHVLSATRLPMASGALRLVAAHDPDASVRARALAAGAPSRTDAPLLPGRVELRSGRDTLVRTFGDSADVGVRFVSRDRKEVMTTFALARPLQVIVLDVQADGRLDIHLPDLNKRSAAATLTAAGPLRVSPRRLPASTIAETDQLALDQAEQRRQSAVIACEGRALAKAVEEDRRRAAQQRGDAAAAARGASPAAPTLSPQQLATACNAAAPVSVAGVTTKPSRLVDGPPAEGYQLLLASPVALSRIELIARLGVLRATPVPHGAALASLARTIYDGHPAPWSAIVVGW